jgi:hypothetical protein
MTAFAKTTCAFTYVIRRIGVKPTGQPPTDALLKGALFFRRFCFFAFLWVGLFLNCPGDASADFITLMAGIDDNFALPTDPASPSPTSVQMIGGLGKDFDETTVNLDVGHTFSGLPSNIIAATLEFHVRAGFNAGGEQTDAFQLYFSDATGANNVYSRKLGNNGADPGLLVSTAWTGGTESFASLDLGALPLLGGGTLDLIPELNSRGFIDVVIGDDTTVDFYRLKLETAAVPEPSSLMLLAMGGLATLGATCWRRRKQGTKTAARKTIPVLR